MDHLTWNGAAILWRCCFVSERTAVPVHVLHLCVCVYGEWRSRLQTADPFHRGWTLTTSRCPKCDDQTKYFGFDKKSRRVCFDSVALRRRKTFPTDEHSVSNSFAHTLHAIVPQCQSRNSIDIPGNSSFFHPSTQLWFLSSLFIWPN